MSFKTTLARILSSAGPTLRRFWVPVLLTIAMTLSMILVLSEPYYNSWEGLSRFAAAIVPGVLAALCTILFWERRTANREGEPADPEHIPDNPELEPGNVESRPDNGEGRSGDLDRLPDDPYPKNPELTANLVGLVAAVLVSGPSYLGLSEFNHISLGRHSALTLFLFLSFFVVPHYRKEGSLEMYTVKLFAHGAVSALFSAVMFIGLSAITGTISSLFSLDVSYDTYLRIWMVMAGVLAPFLFMAGIPKGTVPDESEDYPKVLKNLVLFVLTPLLTAYTAILYVYFAKILITRQWPVGLVAHLVLWYAIFSTALLLFVWPLTSKNGWAEVFSKYFIKAVIPLLLMMFVSIGIRINYYGITENRYYVLVLGLWVLGSMVYLNLKKPRKNIVLPASLAIVVALSVIGPWSSFAVSKWSQNRRLEGLLNRYGMIQDEAIVHPKAKVSDEDRREMAEVLIYFNRNHDLSDVRLLPADFTLDQFPKVFGFSYVDSPYSPDHYFGYQGTGGALDVSGYRYLFQFTGLRSWEGPVTSYQQGSIAAAFNQDTQTVSVALNDNLEWKQAFIQHIRDLEPVERLDKIEFSQEEMTIVAESSRLSIKVIITSLSGSVNSTTGDPVIHHIEFYLLVGDKGV